MPRSAILNHNQPIMLTLEQQIKQIIDQEYSKADYRYYDVVKPLMALFENRNSLGTTDAISRDQVPSGKRVRSRS